MRFNIRRKRSRRVSVRRRARFRRALFRDGRAPMISSLNPELWRMMPLGDAATFRAYFMSTVTTPDDSVYKLYVMWGVDQGQEEWKVLNRLTVRMDSGDEFEKIQELASREDASIVLRMEDYEGPAQWFRGENVRATDTELWLYLDGPSSSDTWSDEDSHDWSVILKMLLDVSYRRVFEYKAAVHWFQLIRFGSSTVLADMPVPVPGDEELLGKISSAYVIMEQVTGFYGSEVMKHLRKSLEFMS